MSTGRIWRARNFIGVVVGIGGLIGVTAGAPNVSSGGVTAIQLAAAASNPVDMTLGQTAVMAVGASNIAAGDTIQRILDLTNTGSTDVASITLTTTSSTSNLLTQNPPPSGPYSGLAIVIDECPVAWQLAPATNQYSCPAGPGAITTIVASRPVLMNSLSLGSVNALNQGGTDHFRIVLTLPGSAGNAFENLGTSLTYTFTSSTDPSQPECAGITFANTIVGTNGNDTLTGANGNKNDVILGLQGNDTLNGNNGSDCIIAGNGNNAVSASPGSRVLVGTGTNTITIANGAGTTKVFTGGRTLAGAPASAATTTTSVGSSGNSTLHFFGGNGNDTIYLANGTGPVDGGGGTNVCHVPKLTKVNYTITNCSVVSP